jgi:hypothetical protein
LAQNLAGHPADAEASLVGAESPVRAYRDVPDSRAMLAALKKAREPQ